MISLFLLWITYITRLASSEHRFGTGIAYRTIPKAFPVYLANVPGCSQNSYGTNSNSWAQKKFVKFRKSTQNKWSCPAKFFGKFFSDPLINFFWNLGDVLLGHSWIKCVLWLTVPWNFRCFSRNCRELSIYRQRCHDSEAQALSVVKTDLTFEHYNRSVNVLLFRGKTFNENKQLTLSEKEYNNKGYKSTN